MDVLSPRYLGIVLSEPATMRLNTHNLDWESDLREMVIPEFIENARKTPSFRAGI